MLAKIAGWRTRTAFSPNGCTRSYGRRAGSRAEALYGMPAYARDGKVVCFFQSAQKFKSRYATLGFSDQARLDEARCGPPPMPSRN
ncbi:hypothetical protein [Streptomyces stelliscabiei]|uniref:hypothetical protein n=1 Tax=Streptomyces stelliscabiei TaxID=146820 RepID=UPI002FF00F94